MASLIRLTVYLGGLAALTSGSCIHGTSLMPRAVGDYTYSGATGPLNWHALDPKNRICAVGRNQTPINILPGMTPGVTTVTAMDRPRAKYPPVSSAKFENLRTTVQVTAGGTLTYGGAEYALRQFHFHTPSEHHLADEHFPLEVHFVHERTAADGSSALAVVGVFFEVTAATTSPPLFRNVLGRVRDIGNPGQSVAVGPLDYAAIEKHFRDFDIYRYSGSLTTPPCSEGVLWGVSARPFLIDVETYNAVKDVVRFNSRYTQNLPGRENLLDLAANLLD